MAKIKIPRVKPGDAITAERFNALADAIERGQLRVGQTPGVEFSENLSGTTLAVRDTRPIWAQLTANGGGGSYSFTQYYPVAGGTFTAGTLTGTCYEANSNATVATSTYVRLWLSQGGDWRFQYDHC